MRGRLLLRPRFPLIERAKSAIVKRRGRIEGKKRLPEARQHYREGKSSSEIGLLEVIVAGIGQQAALLQDSIIERSWRRLQEPAHRPGNRRALDEVPLLFEDILLVRVETDDEAAGYP